MNNTPNATAGANVRAEMARRAISQASLGEALGLSQASVSLRLNGKVAFSIDELARAAGLFGVSLETLVAGVAVG